jgi:hypothetical protein
MRLGPYRAPAASCSLPHRAHFVVGICGSMAIGEILSYFPAKAALGIKFPIALWNTFHVHELSENGPLSPERQEPCFETNTKSTWTCEKQKDRGAGRSNKPVWPPESTAAPWDSQFPRGPHGFGRTSPGAPCPACIPPPAAKLCLNLPEAPWGTTDPDDPTSQPRRCQD